MNGMPDGTGLVHSAFHSFRSTAPSCSGSTPLTTAEVEERLYVRKL